MFKCYRIGVGSDKYLFVWGSSAGVGAYTLEAGQSNETYIINALLPIPFQLQFHSTQPTFPDHVACTPSTYDIQHTKQRSQYLAEISAKGLKPS